MAIVVDPELGRMGSTVSVVPLCSTRCSREAAVDRDHAGEGYFHRVDQQCSWTQRGFNALMIDRRSLEAAIEITARMDGSC